MADLNVQPKKNKSILPWILLILGVLALLFFLLRGCNNDKSTTPVATDTDTAANTASSNTPAPAGGWNDVDFNAPAATYPEITDTNISVRGNTNYGIYGLGENILFDEGKSTIRKDAEANLKQIATSITQRYNGGQVRIFGFTDSVGGAGDNKELSQQRAQAVSDWLSANGNISKDRLSLQPEGEANPVASNNTSEGRQQNRRVEIVARSGQGNQ